jgi:hypothetical protein
VNLIGIDPASHSGIVVISDDSRREGSCCILLAERVTVRSGAEWMADIGSWSHKLDPFTEEPHSTRGGCIAIIEAQHLSHVSKGGAGVLIPAQVAGWWVAVCQSAGIDVASVDPAKWQTWAGIKRRSKTQTENTKKQARRIARERFGPECDREDVADAALIADWARNQEQLVTAWQAG